jgi:hypothetical protein
MSVDVKSIVVVDIESLYQLEGFELCIYPIKLGLRHCTLSSFIPQFVDLANTLSHAFFYLVIFKQISLTDQSLGNLYLFYTGLLSPS